MWASCRPPMWSGSRCARPRWPAPSSAWRSSAGSRPVHPVTATGGAGCTGSPTRAASCWSSCWRTDGRDPAQAPRGAGASRPVNRAGRLPDRPGRRRLASIAGAAGGSGGVRPRPQPGHDPGAHWRPERPGLLAQRPGAGVHVRMRDGGQGRHAGPDRPRRAHERRPVARGGPPVTLRLLVCGGRDDRLGGVGEALMVGLGRLYGPVTLIHGDARGIDRAAASVAYRLGWDIEPHPADWRGRGRSAGPERNVEMIHANPNLVVGGKVGFDWSFSAGGTEHMVSLARDHQVPAYVLQRVTA